MATNTVERELKKIQWLFDSFLDADLTRYIQNYSSTGYTVSKKYLLDQVLYQYEAALKNRPEVFNELKSKYMPQIENAVDVAVSGIKSSLQRMPSSNHDKNISVKYEDLGEDGCRLEILVPVGGYKLNIFEKIKKVNRAHRTKLFNTLGELFGTGLLKLSNSFDLGHSEETAVSRYNVKLMKDYLDNSLGAFFDGQTAGRLSKTLSSSLDVFINSKTSIDTNITLENGKVVMAILSELQLQSASFNRSMGRNVEQVLLEKAKNSLSKALLDAADTILSAPFTQEVAAIIDKNFVKNGIFNAIPKSLQTTKKLADHSVTSKRYQKRISRKKNPLTKAEARRAGRNDLAKFSDDSAVLKEIMLSINTMLKVKLRLKIPDYKKGMDLTGTGLHNRTGDLVSNTRITNMKNTWYSSDKNNIHFDVQYGKDNGDTKFSYNRYDPNSSERLSIATTQRNPNAMVRDIVKDILETELRSKIPKLGKVTAHGQDEPYA